MQPNISQTYIKSGIIPFSISYKYVCDLRLNNLHTFLKVTNDLIDRLTKLKITLIEDDGKDPSELLLLDVIISKARANRHHINVFMRYIESNSNCNSLICCRFKEIIFRYKFNKFISKLNQNVGFNVNHIEI